MKPTPLQHLTFCEAVSRVFYYGIVPFWVSILLSIASLFVTVHIASILLAAVTGQMALTVIKLFLYGAGLLLSLSTVLAGVPGIARFLGWSGERLGGVAFDYSSAVIGVLLGILPVAIDQNGKTALFATFYDVGIFLLAQALLWFLCYAAFGKCDPHIKEAPWLPRAAGVAFTIIFVWAFIHETWPEVDHKCPEQAAITTAALTSQSSGRATRAADFRRWALR